METKFKEIGASKGEGSMEGTAERFPFTFSRQKSVLNHECWGAEAAAAAKSLQSCLTLCDPIDSSPPGSSVPGILQAKILEWVVTSFSRGLRGCSQNNVDFISFHLIHVGTNWGLLFRTFNCFALWLFLVSKLLNTLPLPWNWEMGRWEWRSFDHAGLNLR